MRPFTLRSYAKLNLTLKVVGRRADGFHELVTLFERIDLCDDIRFSPAPDGVFSIHCDDPAVPCDERNLVWKAARVLWEGEGISCGAKVTIRKRIPVAAGLAGGSSNGATALMGFKRLWGLKISRKSMAAYAALIGSDVAFFLYDTAFAIGTGRGEIIKPLALTARLWHFLVVPEEPVLTRDVYARFSSGTRLTPVGGDVSMMLRSLKKKDPVAVAAALVNDLTASILELKPHLGLLKDKVAGMKGVLGASFSGSGPSVYAITASAPAARRLRSLFGKKYRQVFVVRTCP
jgi:4-diphosphocytidyl-2-C-methyl-D-erythritol kinase